eukprot:4772358-Pyramimonas_sp.AAC.1
MPCLPPTHQSQLLRIGPRRTRAGPSWRATWEAPLETGRATAPMRAQFCGGPAQGGPRSSPPEWGAPGSPFPAWVGC